MASLKSIFGLLDLSHTLTT